jgi:hypothetical protein
MTTVAGRYEIEGEIGRGGMAIVMRARDIPHDRLVAIKLLRPEFAGAVNHKRFLREISVMAHLQHQNIVPLYDSGVLDGVPFYVMPLVDGESLRARIDREKQLPLPVALQITREVAGALAYAHSQGVVHRDVKPENILIAHGHALISDFGIAHAMREAAADRTTGSGLAIGTPAYMSPEQAAGDAEVDGRTDIYSLGCVTFEMLAGVPPFVGPTPQAVIARRMAADAPPVQELRTTVPKAVSDAIARALERVPADRWTTGDEFATALDDLSAEHRPRTSTSSWLVRNRTAAAILVTGIAAAATVAALRAGPSVTKRIALAKQAIAGLRFDEARHQLDAAVARDPTNAEANLWLAQVGAGLDPDSAPEWRHAARVASAGGTQLDSVGKMRARALVALADGHSGDACGALHGVVAAAPADFLAVLSLADCIAADDVVVRNARSPSGWSYRSSVQEAVQLYQQLLGEYPSAAPARAVVFRRLSSALIIEPNRYRAGRAVDDPTLAFASFPSLDGDTLVFVPYPLGQVLVGHSGAAASVAAQGYLRERSILRSAALQWARDFPNDPVAHERLAEALESTGEVRAASPRAPAALTEVMAARRLFGRPELRVESMYVRLLLKDGQFAQARIAAESLLGRWPVPGDDEADSVASIAGVIGRLAQAKELSHIGVSEYAILLPNSHVYKAPGPLVGAVIDLIAAATVSDQSDTILATRDRVEALIRSYTSADERAMVRDALLGRALSMAAPTTGPAIVDGVASRGNYMIDLEQRLMRGDRAGIHAELQRLALLRSGSLPGATSVDATYIESWVRAMAGDTTGALLQLDATLDALPSVGNQILMELYFAGTIPRLMVLRVELSPSTDPRRAHWASAVCDLWRDADDAFQTGRKRMCVIGGRQSA